MSYPQQRKVSPYLLLLPAFLAIAGVIAYPILRAVIMSFQSYSLMRPADIGFIGLGNYVRAIQDEVFWLSLRNTAVYVFASVGFQFLLGLGLALVLNKRSLLSTLSKNLMLIPWVIPGVLGAFMWRWLFNANYGLINDVLLRLGILSERIAWLSRADTAMSAVILTTVWRGMPFFALMLLAGLQAVPDDLYEAARMDGARGWQQLLYVTVPVIMPVIVTTTLLRIIWTANFVDLIYLMTEGGPGYSTQVLSVYTFMTARSTLNYGYSAALSIFLTLFLMLVVLMYIGRARKEGIL
ncbi:MAG: sugar ABC transporter permease [Spirochaetaceae bacterium]|nr:MAG: sugar ABC transporter permease [Spirochaetaceae bacterium]